MTWWDVWLVDSEGVERRCLMRSPDRADAVRRAIQSMARYLGVEEESLAAQAAAPRRLPEAAD